LCVRRFNQFKDSNMVSGDETLQWEQHNSSRDIILSYKARDLFARFIEIFSVNICKSNMF